MKKWTRLDQAETSDGNVVALFEHDGQYRICVNGIDLMSTRQHSSEEKLAELACAEIKSTPKARVLIGGLGFGFTLRATLKALRRDASVLVAEILPSVIAWNRNPAFPFAAEEMADPRVEVVCADVVALIKEKPAAFDGILLDVDNGPSALTSRGNAGLYDRQGLLTARRALRAGGCLAVWSAGADPIFADRMRASGFTVSTQRCRAHLSSGSWHTLFIGRPAAAR
jgi:spermidine synthase